MGEKWRDREVTSIQTCIGQNETELAARHHYLLPVRGERIPIGEGAGLKVEPPELLRQSVADDGTTGGHFIHLVNVKTGSRNPSDVIGLHFTSRMLQSGFSERLAMSSTPDEPVYACASVFRYDSDRRSKTSVYLDGPAQTPANYRDGLVCYRDSTRRRFRTTIECRPAMKPRQYSETCYVLPKRAETIYGSYADYRTEACRRRWYTSSVEVTPVTASSNFIRGFQFADEYSVGDEDEINRRDSEAESSGFSDDEGASLDAVDVHGTGYRNFDIGSQGGDFSFSSQIVVGK